MRGMNVLVNKHRVEAARKRMVSSNGCLSPETGLGYEDRAMDKRLSFAIKDK